MLGIGVNVSRYLKLFGCEIIFKVFHPFINIPKYYELTDGQTYCGIAVTALCVTLRMRAVRGKHCLSPITTLLWLLCFALIRLRYVTYDQPEVNECFVLFVVFSSVNYR